MRTIVIGAGSDLGTHIDGANLGPVQLMNDIKSFYQGEAILLNKEEGIIKSRNLSDRRKNEYEIEKFNSNLYKILTEKIKEEYFPIVVGGDSSVIMPSVFASAKENIDIGLIVISAHPNYNTFETTVSGNIESLAIAAINGYKNNDLRYYHNGKIVQTAKTVIIGPRNIDIAEKDNIKYSGVTIFSTQDIKEKGVEAIMKEAYKIAGFKTKGIHISFSLDILDPEISQGVSTPIFDGLTEEETMQINEYIIKNMKDVLSYDLVDFNPLRDINRKTEQIALNLLAQAIRGAENKKKIEPIVY